MPATVPDAAFAAVTSWVVWDSSGSRAKWVGRVSVMATLAVTAAPATTAYGASNAKAAEVRPNVRACVA